MTKPFNFFTIDRILAITDTMTISNEPAVILQEKVFELMTNTRTKIEGFQTQITK